MLSRGLWTMDFGLWTVAGVRPEVLPSPGRRWGGKVLDFDTCAARGDLAISSPRRCQATA
jgi:hypothetical protein